MHGTVGKLNRALAMLLSILMLVTALPVSAFAETDKTAPEETVAAVTAAETPAQEGEGDAAPAADPTVAPEAPAPNAAPTAAPTDITFRMAPLVTMLLMGLALTSMILPRRRKRKEEED